MEFVFTKHALMRQSKRTIPDPNKMDMFLCTAKLRKRIKAACTKSRIKDGYVYFSCSEKIYTKSPPVYVCKYLSESKVLVVTCFWLE